MNVNNDNWSFVIAAYAVTWVFVLGYWVRLHLLLQRNRAAWVRVSTSTRRDR